MNKTLRLRIVCTAAVFTAVCCAAAYAQTAPQASDPKTTEAPPASAPKTTQAPTPATPELSRFVKEAVARGQTPAQVKDTLLRAGWKDEQVRAALADFDQVTSPSRSAPQTPPAAPVPAQARATAAPVVPAGVPTPPDYVIGPDDVLSIVFWREKDMSSDVSVRPDGKISLPLINDVEASGLTPEQLRLTVTEAAGKFVEDPAVTVVVKAINSRKVFITGQVGKPGPYALGGPTTVLQLIATAGGVAEYAKSDKIVVMRTEKGKTVSYKFNYKDVTEGKKLQQNIDLKPGDTIVVP